MDNETINLEPDGFALQVGAETFTVLVGGVPYFELSVRSSVEREGEPPDRDLPLLAFEQGGSAGRPCFTWTTRSNLWEKKVYSLEVYPDAFAYRITVTGSGALGEVTYFNGARASERRRCGHEVGRYLVPTSMGAVASLPQYRAMAEAGRLELGYLVPPLLAFPFSLSRPGHPWFALGLAPRPGEYDLDHFAFPGANAGLMFSTDFLGYKQVEGEYELPAIVGTPGADEFAALEAHAEWLYAHGGCPRRDFSSPARWWRGPLFCGWSEQAHYAETQGTDIYAAATQQNYTDMSRRLDELGLAPTAIIIDDKWQGTYGEALPDPVKWPDLRGFAEDQHARGRRVVLWFKAWNTEGLPVEECVNLWSQPLGADPNSPAYQRRLRELMVTLLGDGPGGCNCDGFKVDFANVMPLGRNLSGATVHYGLELLKQWFELFYAAAKAVKPDCLINASCAHPYFAAVTDQARLHDYWGPLRAAWEVMSFRRRLFLAALPGILIDTDGVVSSRRETLEYLLRAPELGVPDLYFLSPGSVALTEEDWAAVREVWERYSSSLDSEPG